MHMRNSWGAYFFLCVLSACIADRTSEKLNENELVAYIQQGENGLKQRIEVTNGYLEMIYKPSDLIVSQNYKDDDLNKAELDSLNKLYSQNLYFTLRLSKANKDIERFYQRTNAQLFDLERYFALEMKNDISITSKDDGKSISLLDFHYIKMFGYTDATSFLLIFDRNILKENKEIDVKFNGSTLGLGPQTFSFNTRDIIKTPKLNL